VSSAQEDVQEVSSCQELQNVEEDLDGEYFVTKDINLNNCNFTTIEGEFTGVLDGGPPTKPTIKGEIRGFDSTEGGIFERLEGRIEYIEFEDLNLNKSGRTGALAGTIEGATVSRVDVIGSDVNGETSGVFAGVIDNSTIQNVDVENVEVSGDMAAGLASHLRSGVDVDSASFSSSEIISDGKVGGITADMGSVEVDRGLELENLKLEDNSISGEKAAGLVAGEMHGGDVSEVYARNINITTTGAPSGTIGIMSSGTISDVNISTMAVLGDPAAVLIGNHTEDYSDEPGTVKPSFSWDNIVATDGILIGKGDLSREGTSEGINVAGQKGYFEGTNRNGKMVEAYPCFLEFRSKKRCPNDLDGDGLYEDYTGDNEVATNDYRQLSKELDKISIDSKPKFDFDDTSPREPQKEDLVALSALVIQKDYRGNITPRDIDLDGFYEDVNGDGRFNILDIQFLFNRIGSDWINKRPYLFKFSNQTGYPAEVNVLDVQALFNELSEKES
jgi:hypothetical protein